MAINNITGDVLELIILIVLIVLAFSLITGVQIKQIAEVIGQLFSKVSIKELPQKIGSAMDEGKMIINNGDGVLHGNEEKDLRIETKDQLHIEDGNDNMQNTSITTISKTPSTQIPITDNNVNNGATDNTDLAPQKPKYSNWRYPNIEGLQDPVS